MTVSRRLVAGRGEFVKLLSGSLQVRVFACSDPVSGKRHPLTETVPAGPKARAEAETVQTRLLVNCANQRHDKAAS